ncbi:hypothetical protein LSH36_455g03019 [Paralvinella palmiformis]|uniref:UspA domain-containing protein n=1 Tax=Paralvinella palmiformis TaxID=53620 RepID=A0AAD9MYX2_9ANNE|nr:hypothetical protein LSH36_455g03019 [Paralvinella palmiformis]
MSEAGEKHSAKGEKVKEENKEEKREEGKYRRVVLLAVDGSNVSMRALDWYLDELLCEGSYVICMHSFELPLMHSYEEMYVSPDMWQATLKKEADRTAHMEKVLMRKLKLKGVPGKFIARAGGKPGEAILNAAEDEEVDMIVMGTRGRGKLMRVLLGSVSHYVISNAHCPVLVYRNRKVKDEKNVKAEDESKDDEPSTEN